MRERAIYMIEDAANRSERSERGTEKISCIEDAVKWCVNESADVEFLNNLGVKRVWLKVQGHPVVVRDTLVDAVNVLNELVRKRKSEECLYIW
jgi:hypothetical protein